MPRHFLSKQTHIVLLKEKAEKLFGLTRMLDERLEGNFKDILAKRGAQNSDRRTKLQTLNNELAPFVRQMVKCFPGVAAGYYDNNLKTMIVYEPREELGNTLDPDTDEADLGREAIRHKHEIIGFATTLRGDTLNCIHPILRGEDAIGFVLANEKAEDIYAQLQINGLNFSSATNAWPLINLNIPLWVTARLFLRSFYLQESLKFQGDLKEINIALRKELRNYLAALQHYLEIAYNTLDIGVILSGHDHKVLFYNNFVDKNFLKGHGDETMILPDLFKEMRVTGDKNSFWLQDRSGPGNIFQETMSLYFNGQDRDVCLTGHFLTCSGRRQGLMLTLEELHREKSEREKLSREEKITLIGELAISFAHEIRNPLTIIGGSIELIPEKIEDKEFLLSLVHIIQKEFGRINGTIENLLELIRFSDPIFIPIDLNLLIKDCINFIRVYAKSQIVAIKEKYCGGLPQILGDPGHLNQALLNLIINSLQAMPEGGTLTVSTFYKTASSYIQIHISDNGKGIPANIQDKVFDFFFTTKKHGGGLGLAVVQKIIDAHRGFIHFQSTQGTGTTFTVNLPVKILYS